MLNYIHCCDNSNVPRYTTLACVLSLTSPQPLLSSLSGANIHITVKELMKKNPDLTNLDKLLTEYFISIHDPLGDINRMELVVYNSATIIPTKPQGWLNGHVVSSDCFGASDEVRYDDVLLSLKEPFPTFGKVKRFFSTTKPNGAHDFALLQMYAPPPGVACNNCISPVFGEIHVQLTNKYILYDFVFLHVPHPVLDIPCSY